MDSVRKRSSRARTRESVRRSLRWPFPSVTLALPSAPSCTAFRARMEPSMHHNYDSSISASVTAAEANQSSYVPTAAMQVSFYEAAKAKCLRCKVNSSKAGRHTCDKRRNPPPAATGEKRSRPTRGSAVPPTAPETRLPDPVSTNLDDSQQHSVALQHMRYIPRSFFAGQSLETTTERKRQKRAVRYRGTQLGQRTGTRSRPVDHVHGRTSMTQPCPELCANGV